jgi:hypothetical protein
MTGIAVKKSGFIAGITLAGQKQSKCYTNGNGFTIHHDVELRVFPYQTVFLPEYPILLVFMIQRLLFNLINGLFIGIDLHEHFISPASSEMNFMVKIKKIKASQG